MHKVEIHLKYLVCNSLFYLQIVIVECVKEFFWLHFNPVQKPIQKCIRHSDSFWALTCLWDRKCRISAINCGQNSKFILNIYSTLFSELMAAILTWPLKEILTFSSSSFCWEFCGLLQCFVLFCFCCKRGAFCYHIFRCKEKY